MHRRGHQRNSPTHLSTVLWVQSWTIPGSVPRGAGESLVEPAVCGRKAESPAGLSGERLRQRGSLTEEDSCARSYILYGNAA